MSPSDVSQAAKDLVAESDVVDLHLDAFISVRLFGYDLTRRHRSRALFGHLDLPRLAEGGLTGGMWSITTNPWRTQRGRERTLTKNLRRLRGLIDESDALTLAADLAGYRAARAARTHACFLAIQGGNALDLGDEDAPLPDPALLRVTLVHLTQSHLGGTSSPLKLGRRSGLTEAGRRLVGRLNRHRVFVDLAHVDARGFWDAVEVHDPTQPLVVTHTGVSGVKPHWRNLDDDQLRAVADTGGVVGIMFQRSFLSRPGGPRDGAMVAEHMEHVVRVAGEDAVAIGSDYDGAIVPPSDLPGVDSYPRLVQHLLDRGWPEGRIVKALGASFLRCLSQLRG